MTKASVLLLERSKDNAPLHAFPYVLIVQGKLKLFPVSEWAIVEKLESTRIIAVITVIVIAIFLLLVN
jgi:hypothetical protein